MRTSLATVLFLLLPPVLWAQEPKATEAEPAGTAPATAVPQPAPEPPAPPKVTVLRPAGAYADLPEMAFDPLSLLAGGGGAPKPFFQLLTAIERLADADGDAVLIDLSRPFALNLAQVREVERSFAKVRAAGKRVVCYLENANSIALQLAAGCDRVLMADMGVVDFKSPAMNVTHFKDALDLLGIHAEMTRVGEFKGAVEPFVLPEMSAPLREHYRAMLTAMNDDVVRRIAAGRKLSTEAVRALQQQRLFRADEARDKGLVDALVPWEGAARAMAREIGVDAVELADASPKKQRKSRDLFSLFSELLRGKGGDEEPIEEPEIVVLHLAGGIADGDSAQPGSMVAGPAVKRIDELAANDEVKGVVVRVNSPGGSATASEAIRRALERLAQRKPVVFSMGELAASGGYWITCIGRPIVAEPGTITGSIGVFGLRFQMGALMRRLGVRNEVVALDDGPLMDAMDRPWSDAARSQMQRIVDDVYDRFVGLVADSRKLSRDAVRRIAGGRVWAGAQAVELHLVDRLGGVEDALAMVREQAGPAAADAEVRHLPQPGDFASSLLSQLFDVHVAGRGVTALGALQAIEPRLATLLAAMGRVDGLELLLDQLLGTRSPTEVWAMLPGDLQVR